MQFVDLKVQYASIKQEIDKAINRVVKSGVFIGGPEVEGLEREIAKLYKVKYAIGVNSGTDALFLSLKALGVGDGDEVITSPFTFIATAEVIANCGARPVFADIDPHDFNIDPQEIEKRITKRTKTIIPVHLFGQVADMQEIMCIARKHRLYVIEDAAQAMGAKIKQKSTLRLRSGQEIKNQKERFQYAGTMWDVGCFSFFPVKNLGAFGDGGMVITNNRKTAETLRFLRNHGSSTSKKYFNVTLGTNSRLDAIQAAVLRAKMPHLASWNRKRIEHALYYTELLQGIPGLVTPDVPSDGSHIFHQYTIRVKRRDALAHFLERKGVPTMVYYPLPLHLQPAFRYLGYTRGDFPQAERAARQVLSLPMYPELKKSEIEFICRVINLFYKRTS